MQRAEAMAKKWNGDATPAEKLLLLFTTLLFGKRPFSLTELSSSSRLNASKATVLRLLRQLEQSGAGLLIKEKRGRESFYSLERQGRPDLAPNPEGIAQLALCRDLVFHLLPKNFQEETAQTLALLGSGREDASAASLARGRLDYTNFQEIFAALEQAIRKRVVCSIVYRAAGKIEAVKHLFAPMRILANREAVYIEGWLMDGPDKRRHDDPVRLALQRFQACELTGYTSEKLPMPPETGGELLGMMPGEAFTARIWFARDVADYIGERIWSAGQKLERLEDSSVILTVEMANYTEALAWVLGFGRKAVALEPDWFAREIRRELRAAALNYRKAREKTNGEESSK